MKETKLYIALAVSTLDQLDDLVSFLFFVKSSTSFDDRTQSNLVENKAFDYFQLEYFLLVRWFGSMAP